MSKRTSNEFPDDNEGIHSSEEPLIMGSKSFNQIDIPQLDKKDNREYKYKFCTFVLISLLQIFVNYDVGVVPVMLNWIQEPYNFTESELGIMGCLPYIGYIVISPALSMILLKYNNKNSLTLAFVFNIISLCIFGLAVNKYMFFISKFCIGFSQALFFTYYPIWVDTFAPESHRNLWMAIIQGGIVIGMTLGYILTSLYSYAGEWSWRYSIFTQITFELVLTVLFYLIPKEFINFDPSRDENINFDLCTCDKSKTTTEKDEHFSLPVISELQDNLTNNSKTNLLSNSIEEDSVSCDLDSTHNNHSNLNNSEDYNFGEPDKSDSIRIIKQDSLVKKQSNIAETIFYFKHLAVSNVEYNVKRWQSSNVIIPKVPSLALSDSEHLVRIYSNFEHTMLKPPEYSKCSKCFLNNIKLHQEIINIKNLSVWSKFKLLIKQNVFILTCISVSVLYFEVFGIHYWMTKIGVAHLHVPEKIVHLIFAIECLFGPVLGIVSGSYLIDQIIHHYPNNPLFVDYTLIIWALIACITGIVVITFQNPMTFAICIFIILFYGSALVPTLTLTSVAYLPPYLKPAGASFFTGQYQIFGFVLGTLVPGIVVDIFHNYTAGLYIIYLSGFVGLLTLILICYIKWKRLKLSKLKNKS